MKLIFHSQYVTMTKKEKLGIDNTYSFSGNGVNQHDKVRRADM